MVQRIVGESSVTLGSRRNAAQSVKRMVDTYNLGIWPANMST